MMRKHKPSETIQALVGSLESLRRYLRKKFSKKDFPVRKAPTTDTIDTFASAGIFDIIFERFS